MYALGSKVPERSPKFPDQVPGQVPGRSPRKVPGRLVREDSIRKLLSCHMSCHICHGLCAHGRCGILAFPKPFVKKGWVVCHVICHVIFVMADGPMWDTRVPKTSRKKKDGWCVMSCGFPPLLFNEHRDLEECLVRSTSSRGSSGPAEEEEHDKMKKPPVEWRLEGVVPWRCVAKHKVA